eukprot:scaffold52027_cov27-Prasinocladus_malaysianus.AAC.1
MNNDNTAKIVGAVSSRLIQGWQITTNDLGISLVEASVLQHVNISSCYCTPTLETSVANLALTCQPSCGLARDLSLLNVKASTSLLCMRSETGSADDVRS